jgi:hypothetical protein
VVRRIAIACLLLAGCVGGDDGHCKMGCPSRITNASLYVGDVTELDAPAVSVTVVIDRLTASAPVPSSAPLADASTPLAGQFSGTLETRANDLVLRSYSVTVVVPFGPGSIYTAIVKQGDGTTLLRGTWDAMSEPEVVCDNDCTVDVITKWPY